MQDEEEEEEESALVAFQLAAAAKATTDKSLAVASGSGKSSAGGGGAAWSTAIFGCRAENALRLEAEELLAQGRRADALPPLRRLLYAQLYHGAGGWVTHRVLVVDDSKAIKFSIETT